MPTGIYIRTEEHNKNISKALMGKKLTEEHKENLSKNNARHWLGKKRSKATKRKVSEARMGRKNSKKTKKRMSKALIIRFKDKRNHPMFGKYHSKEARQKMSNAQKGEKSRFWQGGISFEPYSPEFNERLKKQVRKRDNYRCQECFRHQDELYYKNRKKYSLMVHHIDYNKKNSDLENLISLCQSCHQQTNFNREDWTNYFIGKVYR